MFPPPSNYGLERDSNSTNSKTTDRLILPRINLSGPPSPIIPNGFPGGLLYNTVDAKPYYSNGNGWYPIGSGSGGNTATDAFIFYDPTNLALGGGWNATGTSDNMDITTTDPHITSPGVTWSTMYSTGNITLDNATGTFTVVNSGLYKVITSLSMFTLNPLGPNSVTVLLFGGSAPPLTYFATQSMTSITANSPITGSLDQTSMRIWDIGFQLPLKFNWFLIGSATFAFSPLQISFERIGDYNPVPPYP